MTKLSAERCDAIARDVGPLAADLTRLAGKHGLTPATIARHALLIAVPVKGLADWNARVLERQNA